jgi:hypothetical protein
MNLIALPTPRRPTATFAPPRSLDGALADSLRRAEEVEAPFRHLRLVNLLPPSICAALKVLPLEPPPELPVWGEPPPCVRRAYRLRVEGPTAAAVSQDLAQAFADETVTRLIAGRAQVEVAGCPVRLTISQESDGYACEPRTGEGEARFRLVVGLPPAPQGDLGPDLYAGPQTWATQLPWGVGAGFAFAPGPDTWHGFEPRLLRRLRACLVVDYLAQA